jgi:hypothetical protein
VRRYTPGKNYGEIVRGKLKRFQEVHVSAVTAKVLNPIHDWSDDGQGKIIGYRLTDGRRPAFWFVVPCYMIEELKEETHGE